MYPECPFVDFVDIRKIYGSIGVAIAGSMLEPFSSSTRTEIATLIVGVCAAGAVHMLQRRPELFDQADGTFCSQIRFFLRHLFYFRNGFAKSLAR